MREGDLSAESIAGNLGTRIIGRRVFYHPLLPSTMGAARQEARRGAAEGTVIIAGEQAGGRGRLQRAWLSPAGNIALSVILYPDVSSLPYIMMLASLAVARSIEVVTGLKVQVKWPNDILISRKKVSGILVESQVMGGRVGYVIIGIGINVGLRAADFPEIAATATSLDDEAGRSVSRRDVVRHLLREMERLYLTLPDGEPIYQAWRKRVTLGRRVRVTPGSLTLDGVAEAVDESGALLLRLDDGSVARVIAGDVSLYET
jgi:BirA family biotin operon repressor/biotin-[acetyl-CoA-carboxylase] ligase